MKVTVWLFTSRKGMDMRESAVSYEERTVFIISAWIFITVSYIQYYIKQKI